jgi:phosphoribosylanthranilate isomerase
LEGDQRVRVRIKICGITRPEFARAAAEAGADAIGLVFAASPRRVTTAEAARIVDALPPWVTAVGVFVDAPAALIRTVAAEVGLGAVQLHGDESPEVAADLGRLKVVKALGIASEADVDAARAWHERAAQLGRMPDAYLVDARVEGGPRGGTGHTADWPLAARMMAEGFSPLILAGALGPENVAEAIAAVRPWGVDASSSLETEPGVKSPERMAAFVDAVRQASF